MGYYLEAIIGNQQTLAQCASAFQHARVVPLAQEIAIIPITDDLFNEIPRSGLVERFEKLSTGVEKWAQHISKVAPVAYIEAEFFGGSGGQSAVMWSGGSRKFGPFHSEDAINQILRLFKVQLDGAHDEFDAVGLGRHRRTNRWIVDSAP